jgi:5-(hydroxymethyl)furfural/furfural oxidase
VIGVGDLTVCDASLMPSIPCANLNLPIIMMAEKVSDALKARL